MRASFFRRPSSYAPPSPCLVSVPVCRLATFYSRSRAGRWVKGETSGHVIRVLAVFVDCDSDSLIYEGVPAGPSCHTLAPTCYFRRMSLDASGVARFSGGPSSRAEAALPSLQVLEETIASRRRAAQEGAQGTRPSWTAKLLADPQLTCSKIREEADELCRTWEKEEGRDRTVSEAADLVYHAACLLSIQGVAFEEVNAELRRRFGVSGIDEKAGRKDKH